MNTQEPEIVFGVWDDYGEPVVAEQKGNIRIGFAIYPAVYSTGLVVSDREHLVVSLARQKSVFKRNQRAQHLYDPERPLWFLVGEKITYFSAFRSELYIEFGDCILNNYIEIMFDNEDFGPLNDLRSLPDDHFIIKSISPEKLMTLDDGREFQLQWSGNYNILNSSNSALEKMINKHA